MKEREVTSQTIQSNWHRLPKSEKERIKMTEREMLTAVVNGTINEEVIAKAQAMIETKDAANAKRREKESKKAQENAPLKERIIAEILATEPKTATVVAKEFGEGMSVQKASALLRQIVEAGKAVQSEVKVAGKGVQKAYALA